LLLGCVSVSELTITPNTHSLINRAWATETLQDVQSLKQKQRILQQQREALRRKKFRALRQARYINDKIVRNQKHLEHAQASVVYSKQEIERIEGRITVLRGDLQALHRERSSLEREAAKRVKSLYMGERLSLIEMLFSVDRLASLIDRLFYWEKITRQDKLVLDRLKRKTQQIASRQYDLHDQHQSLESQIKQIALRQREIQGSILQDRELKERYLKDYHAFEQAENELLSESNSIQSQIRSWLVSQSKRTTPVRGSTGIISWPLRGRLMSYFGYRVHPIFRRRRYHTGLDISAPSGTPIRSADGGEVISAGWRSGYGKVIIVSHGQKKGRNISTLYAHLSSIGVGVGQNVGKGQVIGRVGSTGWSTGPHLHFEVRVNGAAVDPLGWLR
jgi:murein DD-endopeptidase MepM/ murein hydrolase activator NlpD